MPDQETFKYLKAQLAAQARLFEEKLSAIEASRNNTGGLQEAPAGRDQPPPGFEGAGTSGQGGFSSSRRAGVITDSLLRAAGDEVEIAGGSSLAVGSPEMISIKTAVPKLGSSVELPL